MTFTIKDLERLKSAGLIRNYTAVEVIANPKKSKFGNTKTVIDDIVFQSAKEAKRYIQLRYLLNVGEITNLERQVPYELNEGGSHSLKYVADFVYLHNGETIVEDVKGFRTKEYKKKRNLMKQIYNIEIKET